MLRAAIAALAAFALLAIPMAATSSAGGSATRSVVAVIDSSTNPYHEFFQTERSSVTPAVLAEFGITKNRIITLTRTGNFAADYAADKAKFDAIQPGKPYWFKGTNIIGISFDDSTTRRILPDDSGDTHGVGTTAAVLKAHSNAIVVLVEGVNSDSETWAFTHPAVDIISTSYGIPGSVPTGMHLEDSYRGVVGLGKQHFGAADNSPAASPPDGTSGPWWTIGIAGFHEGSSEGREALSGSLPDFLGDFTQPLPYCFDCESGTRSVSGTSFATPRSAGTFSKILLQARQASGHRGGIVTEGVRRPVMVSSTGGGLAAGGLTNWELRRALEESAYYPAYADYDPNKNVEEDLTSVPINDVAPWAQAGWGALTVGVKHKVVPETLAHTGIAGFGKPTRSKSALTCQFMTLNIDARHAYWDNSPFSQSFGKTADPYAYC
jgi:hypothetical protein